MEKQPQSPLDKLLSRVRENFAPIGTLLLAAFFAVLLVLRWAVGSGSPVEETQPLREQIAPAVVFVTGCDEDGQALASGSGALVFTGRTVVTSLSNVDYCVSATVQTQSGAKYSVSKVLAAEDGIAILKLSESTGLTALPLNTEGTADAAWSFDGETLTQLDTDTLSAEAANGSVLTDGSGNIVGVVSEGETVSAADIYEAYVAATQEQTLRALCQTLHPGYFTYREATHVDYTQLLQNPDAYDGKRIALTGYAVYAEEYSVGARDSELYLLPSAEAMTWTGEPTVALDSDTYTTGYMPYWCFTPFSESQMVRCYDSTHTLETDSYMGGSVTVCGNFSYSDGISSLELLYTGA